MKGIGAPPRIVRWLLRLLWPVIAIVVTVICVPLLPVAALHHEMGELQAVPRADAETEFDRLIVAHRLPPKGCVIPRTTERLVCQSRRHRCYGRAPSRIVHIN